MTLPRRSLPWLVGAFAIVSALMIPARAPAGEDAPAAAPEGEVVLLHHDFEDAVPGTAPAHWRKAWGTQADDRFVVTNEQAVHGDQALLIEHTDHPGQWGLALAFPKDLKKDERVHLSFAFRLEGAGAHYGVELRDANGKDRLLSFGFKNGRIEYWRGKKRIRTGDIRADTWYAVDIVTPAPTADDTAQAEARVTLTNGETGETAEARPFWKTPAQWGRLYLNLPPNAKPFRLYVDAVKIARLPADAPDPRTTPEAF